MTSLYHPGGGGVDFLIIAHVVAFYILPPILPTPVVLDEQRKVHKTHTTHVKPYADGMKVTWGSGVILQVLVCDFFNLDQPCFSQKKLQAELPTVFWQAQWLVDNFSSVWLHTPMSFYAYFAREGHKKSLTVATCLIWLNSIQISDFLPDIKHKS